MNYWIISTKENCLLKKFTPENIFFDDNKIKNASYDQDKGFGLRTVNNDSVNFAHNTELSDEAFSKAIKSVKEQQKLNPNPLNSKI